MDGGGEAGGVMNLPHTDAYKSVATIIEAALAQVRIGKLSDAGKSEKGSNLHNRLRGNDSGK